MDHVQRLEVVNAENDLLRERIAELEQILFGEAWLPPVEWGLTPAEAKVAGVLVTRELASKPAIVAALYAHRPDDQPDDKVIDVFVYKMRRKLLPFGIEIRTLWGRGYHLDPTVRKALHEGAILIETEASR
ncbi:winged helix-turn-helix domain-containing protein [Amorphus coralli]|uniref:winged helix-turn-helix domain-containing protein n=1 Tax=Amorphus coralli TaxID=340680 RepID=UPI00036A0F0A|nr:helix-turn-helix domain-containing protein [Amorphus coralli]